MYREISRVGFIITNFNGYTVERYIKHVLIM